MSLLSSAFFSSFAAGICPTYPFLQSTSYICFFTSLKHLFPTRLRFGLSTYESGAFCSSSSVRGSVVNIHPSLVTSSFPLMILLTVVVLVFAMFAAPFVLGVLVMNSLCW